MIPVSYPFAYSPFNEAFAKKLLKALDLSCDWLRRSSHIYSPQKCVYSYEYSYQFD